MRWRSKHTPAAAAAPAARGILAPMPFMALAGAASVLSFAPFGWWPLQLLTLALLFYQAGVDASVKRAAWLGWAFGFGWSVAGMYWLWISMHDYGHMPGAIAAAAVLLLGACMGIYGAFATGVAAWLRRRWKLPVKSYLLLAAPSTWALSEWLRGTVFTGFPWVASGYAHNDSPLAGFAPLLGVYGIGALAALAAAAITIALTQRSKVLGAGILAALFALGAGLRWIDWTEEHGKPLSVRLLQGNVSQDRKFDTVFIGGALNLYHDMITAAPADLIATPETAIVLFPQQLPPDYLPSLAEFSRRSGSHLLYGIPFFGGEGIYTNSVGGIAPDGRAYRYDKHHLVPFGEFIPYGFRWFTDMMRIPLGDQTRGGAVQAPFAVKDQLVLPNVCYEDAFGEEIAAQLRGAPQPATILLNVSNLAWFGQSTAIPQHLQISQMRSLETGRPMLRATNNGATAIIDHKGRVAKALPYYSAGALAGTVQGTTGMTPFTMLGNWGLMILGALALLAARRTAAK
jgi:apolipoprotein N-acyltransferase